MSDEFWIACQRGDLQSVQRSIAEVSDDARTSGLIGAARNGHAEVVQWLIEHGGCDVNARNSEALFEAIRCGHFDVVNVLVEHGVNTKARASYSRHTPLMVAAARGNKKISRLLLENGADVDGKGWRGQTAIFCTSRLAIVKILVDGGANVNIQDYDARTPLMIHAESGSKDIVSYLVAHGADVHRKDAAGQTALHLAHNLAIVKILVDGGANVNIQDDKGRTPLMIHAEKGNKDIVSSLVAHGADVHRKDSKGRTALHHSGSEIVKLLVDRGSNVEERDCCQITPLVHAALMGNQILAWQLIKCGADVKQLGMTKKQFKSQYNESREDQGQIEHFPYLNLRRCNEALLRKAAFDGNTEMAKTLILACSVDVNCKDKSTGNTPLHVAARGNRVQCGILLVETGSSTEIRNKSSQKPLDLASSSFIEALLMRAAFNDNTEIVKTLILACSVDVNCKDKSTGVTPLHVAAIKDYVQCGILLVEAGSSTEIRNYDSQKPLDLASKGFIEAIQQTLSFTARKTVCIIGNACSGKSTIIASLQNENAPIYKKIVHWFRGVDDISQRTAGIDPVLIESQNYGNTIFFDFAGQNEYHGPHEMFLQSILSKSRSTVTIIVVVKVTEEEAVISQQVHRWLYPLSTMSVTASNPIQVIIIGSFLDKVKDTQVAIDKVNRCCSELEHSLSDVPINIQGQCFFNCRQPYSSNFDKLRVYLRDVPIPEFRALDTPYSICWVISHMKDLTEHKSIRLSVFEEWIKENRANLPVNMPSVEEVCKDLSSTGHFLYIPNNEEVKNGWLVLDLPAILHEVYGKLYSPSQRTANEFGLLNCRKLVNLFPDFDQTMIHDVLIAMEFCIDIDPKFFREEVVKLLPEHEQSHDFLFFPSLVSPDVAYVDIFASTHSSEIRHTLCWHLQAHKQHLITPRLLQTILLRLAVRHVQFSTNEITDPLCSVWSKGIFWQTPGMEVAVQVSDTRVIQVIGRSYTNTPPDKLIKYMSTVVCDIGNTVRQLSPKLKFTTFIIHGVSSRQLLKKPSSPTPHQMYPLKMILKSTREGEKRCLSCKGQEQIVAKNMEIAQLFCGLIPSEDIVQKFYPGTCVCVCVCVFVCAYLSICISMYILCKLYTLWFVCCTTQGYGVFILLSLIPAEGNSPFATNAQPTTIDPTTGPTQPTTIDPTTGPTQPTTIDPTTGPTQPTTMDPTTGPTQPTTIDPTTGPTQPTTNDPTTGPTQPTSINPNVSADQVKRVLRTAGYSELKSLISYNDYVQDELYMNRSLISREVNEYIESKPTKSEKAKYLLKHVLNNSDLDWLKELAAVLENDPGNRQNQEAGRMLMAAIGRTMDPPTTAHCQGTFVWVHCVILLVYFLYSYPHTHTYPHTNTHTHTHARTHPHTHTHNSKLLLSNYHLPDDPILTTPTIEDLTRLVVPMIVGSDWYSIGCQLGMESSILKAIEPDNPLTGSTSTCGDVFSRWLSGVRGTGESPRIWKTVLIAIKDAGYPSIAEDVRRSLSSNSTHP